MVLVYILRSGYPLPPPHPQTRVSVTGDNFPHEKLSGLSGAHQLDVFTNSSLNEYLNALSKHFSRRQIDIFFSEKKNLTQTGGSPSGLGCGCKEFYPAPGV